MTEEIVKLWKKLGVTSCVLTFDCGGDSMGDMEWAYFGKNNKEIVEGTDKLTTYFDDNVFKAVEFYVNSDGHYIGENGIVTITLNEDGEFDYVKEARSEFYERYTDSVLVEVTEDEKKFLEEKVSNLGGGSSGWRADDELLVNYKTDCILSKNEQEMLEKLMAKLEDEAENHEFENPNEPQEDYTWTSGDEISFNGIFLEIFVSRDFYEYRDSE